MLSDSNEYVSCPTYSKDWEEIEQGFREKWNFIKTVNKNVTTWLSLDDF